MNTPSPLQPTTQPIRFYHRGEVVEVSGVHPTRTVLDWLREDAHCTGTKEGCNEGDCGACTVVIGELAGDGASDAIDGLTLQTVNACIQFLPTLDGKALFTVEDLKNQQVHTACSGADKASCDSHPHSRAKSKTIPLHPLQQAMVECHASQCGFCTPGFAMSLWSVYEQHQAAGSRPSRQQLADELSGNLCRCTGYRPILDAGQRMFDLPAARLDAAPVVHALQGLREAQTASLNYAATTAEARDRFYSPRALDELAALRNAKPAARVLAGSTDVGLWVNKQFRDLGEIIYIGNVDELKAVETRGDQLYIGAGASLESAWKALATRAPSLTDVWLRFASRPIRNAGTMGGNVANGSPIGDSPPVLMALDAQIELRRGERVRSMPLSAFYIDYMKNHLEPGEFVQGLSLPLSALSAPGLHLRAYKISKRFDCDISALCAGMAVELEGDTVRAVRLAYGGMAATVKRAANAEAALVGQRWDQQAVKNAQAALAQDFKPMSDMRASAAYRLKVARNLLQRLWLETRVDGSLSAEQSSVWSSMPHDVLPSAEASAI